MLINSIMRINEILQETTKLNELTRPADQEAAEEKLLAAGYEKVGTGTWATVFSKPGDSMVVKLFHSADQAYTDFVKLAMQHQDNPHFPKFRGKMMRVTDEYNAIRMERLEPNTSRELAELLEDYLYFLSGEGQSYERTRTWALFSKNLKLNNACKLIAATLLKTHYLDLQPTNIMMRGKTPVFLDPVASA